MVKLPRIQLSGVRYHPYGAEQTQQPDWYAVDFDYDGLLVSEPHWRLPNGSWSGGGPLYVEHISVRHEGKRTIPKYKLWGNELGPINLVGVGDPVVYRPPGSGSPKAVGSTSVDVARAEIEEVHSENYTRGILATRPGRPEAGIGQFLAELRDLPSVPGLSFWRALSGVNAKGLIPAVKQGVANYVGASADELLNWDFGWRPFLQDLRGLYKVTKSLHKRLDELAAGSGKIIRKGKRLEDTTTSEVVADAGNGAPFWLVGGGSVIVGVGRTELKAIRVTHTRRWFEAAYRYWVNDPGSWLWRGKAVAALFGVLPTPELLYDITPWSWLADWFTDVGDLAALYSPTAVDALSTLRAFTMRHRVTTTTWEATTHMDPVDLPLHSWARFPQHTFRSVYRVESKLRGTGWAPFGTRIPSPPLTQRQEWILAALGISQARGRTSTRLPTR